MDATWDITLRVSLAFKGYGFVNKEVSRIAIA